MRVAGAFARSMIVIMTLGAGLEVSRAAQDLAPSAKHTKKTQSAVKPTAPPTGAPVSPNRVPMDFSGMDKSVKDLRNPSNARSNGQFNGDDGTARSGFSPGATFKF